MSHRELIFIGVAVLVVVVVARLLVPGSKSPQPRRAQPPSARPAYRSPAQRPPAPARTPSAAATEHQIARARVVFQKRIGAAREAEQERIRQQVLSQERRIADRLARAQREHDFEELRSLHRGSRETADLAYTAMKSAFATIKELSAAISRTHRAIDADRPRGGRQVPTLRRTLDALHQDKTVLNTYCRRYQQDLDRLNLRTGKLRDAIGANCGPQGRAWYQALMARTAARRDDRPR
jgi:hypothetical protein